MVGFDIFVVWGVEKFFEMLYIKLLVYVYGDEGFGDILVVIFKGKVIEEIVVEFFVCMVCEYKGELVFCLIGLLINIVLVI